MKELKRYCKMGNGFFLHGNIIENTNEYIKISIGKRIMEIDKKYIVYSNEVESKKTTQIFVKNNCKITVEIQDTVNERRPEKMNVYGDCSDCDCADCDCTDCQCVYSTQDNIKVKQFSVYID